MTIAVVGGTGSVGALVVAELAKRAAAVRIIARHAPAVWPDGTDFRVADLQTGAGMTEALDGCSTVINTANGNRATLVEGLKNLLVAELRAGIGHHVEIGIVGSDRTPISYYRVKIEQEEALAHGDQRWTLLRAAQFHTLVAKAMTAAAKVRLRPSSSIRLQPIDPAVVAARLADLAQSDPAGRVDDLAGPQVQTISELGRDFQAYADRTGRPHRFLPVPLAVPGRLGRALRDGSLCAPDSSAPGPTFAEWLAR